jgi:hypothetical protein
MAASARVVALWGAAELGVRSTSARPGTVTGRRSPGRSEPIVGDLSTCQDPAQIGMIPTHDVMDLRPTEVASCTHGPS